MRPQAKDNRPVNLDLGTISLPITAYVSIAHRISGVLMFFASFLLLLGLDKSLTSQEAFNDMAAALDSSYFKLIAWALTTILSYHALSGIKHLCMDAGIGETMDGGVIGARLVFLLAGTASVLLGVVIW